MRRRPWVRTEVEPSGMCICAPDRHLGADGVEVAGAGRVGLGSSWVMAIIVFPARARLDRRQRRLLADEQRRDHVGVEHDVAQRKDGALQAAVRRPGSRPRSGRAHPPGGPSARPSSAGSDGKRFRTPLTPTPPPRTGLQLARRRRPRPRGSRPRRTGCRPRRSPRSGVPGQWPAPAAARTGDTTSVRSPCRCASATTSAGSAARGMHGLGDDHPRDARRQLDEHALDVLVGRGAEDQRHRLAGEVVIQRDAQLEGRIAVVGRVDHDHRRARQDLEAARPADRAQALADRFLPDRQARARAPTCRAA